MKDHKLRYIGIMVCTVCAFAGLAVSGVLHLDAETTGALKGSLAILIPALLDSAAVQKRASAQ